MAGKLLPTTRAQVSGHKFLRRRVEHGLIFGDIRMIHDPLVARKRASILGLVAAVLIAAVAGLLAWLQPNANPGEAAVLRSPQGSLFVRIDDRLHPVSNLTSARLILDEPVVPASIGEELLAQEERGAPLGIAFAPSDFAPAEESPAVWAVCHSGEEVLVTVGVDSAGLKPLANDAALVARVGKTEWLVSESSRRQLPSSSEPGGRAVRRVLGISPQTPRWEPPAEVLNALKEGPPIELPKRLPTILITGETSWIKLEAGGVQPITAAQEEMLKGAGAERLHVDAEQLASYPDAAQTVELRLPERPPNLLDADAQPTCVTQDSTVGWSTQSSATEGATELSGSSVATHSAGLNAGAVGVDTGHSFHLVSAEGQRHAVTSDEAFEALGVERVDKVGWEIVKLLPEGAELNREAAMETTY